MTDDLPSDTAIAAQQQQQPSQGSPAPSDGAGDSDPHAEIASLQRELTAQSATAQTAHRESERLQRELKAAVDKYRQALVASAPEVPAEMVAGETVAELEASLAHARALVEKVRGQIESQTQTAAARGRVPAGAPPRRAADLSSFSPREKIALGLERR